MVAHRQRPIDDLGWDKAGCHGRFDRGATRSHGNLFYLKMLKSIDAQCHVALNNNLNNAAVDDILSPSWSRLCSTSGSETAPETRPCS